MTLDNARQRIIGCFNRSIFPEPNEFTDSKIAAIATIPGVDESGTFADSPIEQSLIRRYGLEARYGEHTWPGFAETLREQKSIHVRKSSFEIKYEQLATRFYEAKMQCLQLGMSEKQIAETINRAKRI